MFYEMGIHLIKYGRMPEYVDRYDKPTGQLGACRRSGIELFGVWTDDIGVGNKFRYIVKWESMEQRVEGWAKFRVDKLWTEGRAATEKDDGPWTEDSWNSFLLLTPYSPEPKVTSKVQELLVYEAIQGKVGLLNDLLANHAMGYFKKYGIDLIGVWSHDVGNKDQLTCMLGYDSLADREKTWAGLRSDAGWLKALGMTGEEGRFIRTDYSTILRPLPFMFER